jgi:hypothetical protein
MNITPGAEELFSVTLDMTTLTCIRRQKDEKALHPFARFSFRNELPPLYWGGGGSVGGVSVRNNLG